MMDLELNMDEMMIVQTYSGVSRRDTVRRAMMASAYVDNDCIDLMASTIAKLTLMTDEEFDGLGMSDHLNAYEYLEEDEG